MATSKLIPIKVTLNKAIDYIVNPDKTDNGRLVSSFGCSPKTADIEMKLTADKGSGIGDRIAYHLIQSFSPDDDITPEKALELGKEFANKVTGGKYEYVIATHIDQGHIHNHIIFNATSFVTQRKYHHDERDKYRIRRINDKICKANNLSVIEKYSGKKGYGKYEYEKRKKGSSWKAQIEKMIDSTIAEVSSFEEFIERMELEGYEVQRGKRKHISFRAPGQEKVCRGETIGEAYTEEAIRDRIENKSKYQKKEKEQTTKDQQPKEKTKSSFRQYGQKNKINLIVDISKNLKAQESKGYEQALIKGNINTLVKTMNYLIQHNLKTPEDFYLHYSNQIDTFDFAKKNRKRLSDEMLNLHEKIKFTQNYKKNKKIFLESLSVANKQDFYRNHEEEIIQYKSSLIYFEREGLNPDKLNLYQLFEDYRALKQEKIENDQLYKTAKEKKYELDIIKQNVEYALNMDWEKEEKVKIEAAEKDTDIPQNISR